MRRGVPVALAVAALSVAACGTQDAVAAAQAEVAAKQESLAEAEAAATQAQTEFCQSSEQYIVALDRYGDVLNQTAPTVGDVVDAGADLSAPREDTQSAADQVVSSREAVTQAERELAEAQAALAAAEAEAAGRTPPPTAPGDQPTAEPTEPPAGLARVQQAEAEFADAQAGITDSTPLVQAAEQFNAAAVALEMAWLAAFTQSGCLTDERQQQAVAAIRDYNLALQTDLATAGYYGGEVDGVYGPATMAAVQALQEANGLPQTGTMDKATEAALRSELTTAGGLAAQEAMVSTAALQQTLRLTGYWDGPVDGQWTDALTDALKQFQTDLGVEPTGTVDAATITAFHQALADAQQTLTPTPEPSAAPSPTQPTDEPAAGSLHRALVL